MLRKKAAETAVFGVYSKFCPETLVFSHLREDPGSIEHSYTSFLSAQRARMETASRGKRIERMLVFVVVVCPTSWRNVDVPAILSLC